MNRENNRGERKPFAPLAVVAGVGGLALTGVLFEAAQGNIIGAAALVAAGAVAMAGAGIAIEKLSQSHDN